VDPEFEKEFYRLGGFRILGKRAVRIDILERLADLIRPAIHWKPGDNSRPEGAYGDGRFLVTPAMMSILGAKAEDMEEILKALGYQGENLPEAEVSARLASLAQQAATAAPAAEPAGAVAEAGTAEDAAGAVEADTAVE